MGNSLSHSVDLLIPFFGKFKVEVSQNPVWTKPLARRTLRVRYSGHDGLPKLPESTFAYFANSTSFSMLQAKIDSIPIA